MSAKGPGPDNVPISMPVVFDAPNDPVLEEVKQISTEAVAFWAGTFKDYLDTLSPQEQEAVFVEYFLQCFRDVMSEDEEGEGKGEGEAEEGSDAAP